MSDLLFGKVPPDQPIFSTSMAADLLGLHPRTLRMYENAGFVVPTRTESNRRQYSQNDLAKLALAARLTQQHGLNLAGVKLLFSFLNELKDMGIDADEAFSRALIRASATVETQ